MPDDTDTLYDRILRRLDRLGIAAEDASKRAGMGRDGIRNIKRGKSESPRGANLKALADVLECSVDYLLGHEPDEAITTSPDLPPEPLTEPPHYLPVSSIIIRAGMGGGRLVEEEILGPPRYFDEDLIRLDLRAQPVDLRVVEVEGPSMEPVLRNRDRVLVDVRKRSLAEPGLFVLYDGEGLVCKWVQRVHGSEPARIKISSENKAFDPYEVLAEQANIIGRVVWFARQF